MIATLSVFGFVIKPGKRVSAMRESAVVFGALFGWLFLKEGFGVRRLVFAAITASGLAMMNL